MSQILPAVAPERSVTGNAKPPVIKIKVDAARSVRSLRRTLILLVVLGFAAMAVRFSTGHGNLYGLLPLFDLDSERNIPSYFSSCILLLSAGLLALIAHIKRQAGDAFTSHWAVLAGIFLYLSVDEAASIHEMLIDPLRNYFHLTGVLYYSWVVVGGAAVLGFIAYFMRFFLSLEQREKVRFAVSAVIYVGGALGVELMGGYYSSGHGEDNFTYKLLTILEETLEMTGILLFIHALLLYLKKISPKLKLRIN